MANPTACNLRALRSHNETNLKIINPQGAGSPRPLHKTKNMETNEKKAIELTTDNGGVTEENINQWKNKFGRVSEVTVEDEEAGLRLVGYFRRPDMATMQAFSATAKSNEVKAAEVLFDNCWLGGASLMKTDAVYKMEGMNAMQGIFGRCTRALKNL